MNKLHSTIMMLAMMVAALCFTACGSDDDNSRNNDDERAKVLIGVWKVTSVKLNGGPSVRSKIQVGDELCFYEDHYYSGGTGQGRWSLEGNYLTLHTTIPAKMYIEKLTSTELTLSMTTTMFSATIKCERAS